MSLIYPALMLRSAGKPITRDNLNAVLKAAGLQADPVEIDALLSLLGEPVATGSQRQPGSGGADEGAVRIDQVEDAGAALRPEQAATARPTQQSPSQTSTPPESGKAPNPHERALYVYAVAVGEPVQFESSGIERTAVFALAEGGLVATVHECAAQPYSSEDKEVVEKWVLSHQAVVEEASRHYGAILPMAFDTMVSGKDSAEAQDRLRAWLRDDADLLRRKAERVRNREEYGVQVLLDVASASRQATDTCPAIIELRKGLEGKSAGAAYLHKPRLEKLIREEIQKRAETVFREAFELAGQHSVEVSVDDVKKAEGNMRMVANLSCLVEKGRDEVLKAAFNSYCAGNGLAARVVGPLPPYSFV
ncbi:MAG: GvpL/GvpF family gas vesicle protein [Candidatus Brocadiae bacterium]|nr:GvpL/GvpF family gas vesicle protein [Candidatus Brocadiia bacterium]